MTEQPYQFDEIQRVIYSNEVHKFLRQKQAGATFTDFDCCLPQSVLRH